MTAKKNANIGSVHEVLMDQLTKLNDPDVKGEELEAAIKRSKAVTDVANVMVKNAALGLQASREFGGRNSDKRPEMLRITG